MYCNSGLPYSEERERLSESARILKKRYIAERLKAIRELGYAEAQGDSVTAEALKAYIADCDAYIHNYAIREAEYHEDALKNSSIFYERQLPQMTLRIHL